MCGLSGIVSNQKISANAITASLKSIKHRGPDDSLIFSESTFFFSEISNDYSKANFQKINSEAQSDCWFGFNRLAIVDVSPEAMQPLYDEKTQTLFMMNGEVYNYESLHKNHLEKDILKSRSDSEVAFKLYLKLGDQFIHLLQGMFAIVIYDFKSRSLNVWRDRLGIKPFYYAFQNGHFIFSSEMKGIFATELCEKKIDFQGLAYSMYLGTCPAPKTIYQDIHSLQAGHFLTFSLATQKIIVKPFWTLKYDPSTRAIEKEEFNQDLKSLCELYKTGEVEKALMISGGMDSGILAYYYGFIFDKMKGIHISDLQQSEAEFAKLNAENAQVDFVNFTINKPTKETVIHYLTSEEEPNASPEPAYFLSEKAEQLKIKVLYNALGPDEVFGGYDYFQRVNKFKFLQPFLTFIPAFLLPAKYQSKFIELKKFGLAFYPMMSRRLFSWDEIKHILQADNQEIPIHPVQFISEQINSIYPDFKELPVLKQISYVDIFYYISSHHSFRSDQPSMRFGIEMRFPFLEHTFIEKYFNQATVFDKLNKSLKPYFREMIADLLPVKVVTMKKQGFKIPVEEWVEILDNSKKYTYFEAMQKWYKLSCEKLFSSF